MQKQEHNFSNPTPTLHLTPTVASAETLAPFSQDYKRMEAKCLQVQICLLTSMAATYSLTAVHDDPMVWSGRLFVAL